jgi:hypothetical protein
MGTPPPDHDLSLILPPKWPEQYLILFNRLPEPGGFPYFYRTIFRLNVLRESFLPVLTGFFHCPGKKYFLPWQKAKPATPADADPATQI